MTGAVALADADCAGVEVAVAPPGGGLGELHAEGEAANVGEAPNEVEEEKLLRVVVVGSEEAVSAVAEGSSVVRDDTEAGADGGALALGEAEGTLGELVGALGVAGGEAVGEEEEAGVAVAPPPGLALTVPDIAPLSVVDGVGSEVRDGDALPLALLVAEAQGGEGVREGASVAEAALLDGVGLPLKDATARVRVACCGVADEQGVEDGVAEGRVVEEVEAVLVGRGDVEARVPLGVAVLAPEALPPAKAPSLPAETEGGAVEDRVGKVETLPAPADAVPQALSSAEPLLPPLTVPLGDKTKDSVPPPPLLLALGEREAREAVGEALPGPLEPVATPLGEGREVTVPCSSGALGVAAKGEGLPLPVMGNEGEAERLPPMGVTVEAPDTVPSPPPGVGERGAEADSKVVELDSGEAVG